jgi:hypothetical protein
MGLRKINQGRQIPAWSLKPEPEGRWTIEVQFGLSDGTSHAAQHTCLSEKGCINWVKEEISKRVNGEIRTPDNRDLSEEVAMYEHVLREAEKMLKRHGNVLQKE